MSPAAGQVPAVLCFSGLDPSGGAGIQADIEALASHGCHACPVITATTVQDSRQVYSLYPGNADLAAEQARRVLEDMPVAAIKVGLIGSVPMAEAIAALAREHPAVPLVVDPVLASGAGDPLADAPLRQAVRDHLCPLTTVLTPNSEEARAMAPGAETLDDCARELLSRGCEFVLVTGTHEPGEQVINRFYGQGQHLEDFPWPRLPQVYHGSGCTLAASIAGLLAQGRDPMAAVHGAQEYTHQTLLAAYRAGHGQWFPNRLFWARGGP